MVLTKVNQVKTDSNVKKYESGPILSHSKDSDILIMPEGSKIRGKIELSNTDKLEKRGDRLHYPLLGSAKIKKLNVGDRVKINDEFETVVENNKIFDNLQDSLEAYSLHALFPNMDDKEAEEAFYKLYSKPRVKKYGVVVMTLRRL